ncbi:MAG: hypothetical protein ACP5KV_05960 [Candidatus Methanomethylicaceae archaeon]
MPTVWAFWERELGYVYFKCKCGYEADRDRVAINIALSAAQKLGIPKRCFWSQIVGRSLGQQARLGG